MSASALAAAGPDDRVAPDPTVDAPRWQVGTLSYSAGGLAFLVLLLLWGDFAWSMKERSVAPVLQLVLRGNGASDFLVGLLMGTVPGILNLLLGPVISYRSDRLRTRWGRRIPFLLASTPLIVLSLLLLAAAPAIGGALARYCGAGEAARQTIVIATIAGAWLIFDLTSITANAVFGGLVNDVVPRAWIGRFYGLFRALSLLAAIVFNLWLIGRAGEHADAILCAVGLLYGLGFGTMCLRVREGVYPPPPAASRSGGAADYARQCFGSGYFVLIYGALALASASFLAVNAFSLFAADHFGLSTAEYGQLLAASYTASLLLALPLGWLSDRFHPLRVGAVALLLYLLVVGSGALCISGPRSFAAVFAAQTVLSGIFFTGTAGLGQLLYPRHAFAQLSSACALCTGLTGMMLQPALGWLLDHNGRHYETTYAIAAVLGALTLAVWLVLLRRVQRLGGFTAYAAPGESRTEGTP